MVFLRVNHYAVKVKDKCLQLMSPERDLRSKGILHQLSNLFIGCQHNAVVTEVMGLAV